LYLKNVPGFHPIYEKIWVGAEFTYSFPTNNFTGGLCEQVGNANTQPTLRVSEKGHVGWWKLFVHEALA
jgi:hypothetical protein